MRNPLSAGITCLAILLLISCGPSKKLRQARADAERLQGQVDSLNTRVNDLNTQVNTLTTQNSDLDRQMKECVAKEEDVRKQKEQMESTLKEQGASMTQVKDKLSSAMSEFSGDGVEVTNKDGMVSVSLPDKLMFKPGSSSLTKYGNGALASVAGVLNENPDMKVMVVGHTDSVNVRGYKDNWSASTERANTVVRLLRDKHEVDPARLIAAGRSKYGPIDDNATTEGRARNRRTEIILAPDLSKLWALIESQ